MKKILIIFVCLFPTLVYAFDMPDINSASAIVYDLDSNEVILDKNSTELRSVASLTKIMSVLVAIEEVDNIDNNITVTSSMLRGIYWNASVAGLKAGDIVTYRDLLYAAILPSGADATQVLAYVVSGNVSDYVTKMNDLAKEIGALNTNYTNTIGLDSSEGYSTAYDQMLILAYALDNPLFKEIYTTKEYTLSNGLEVKSTIAKYNEVLNLDTSKIIGSKTGNTNNAGLCMSALFYHEDHELILITLGASLLDKTPYNLIDALTIIDTVNTSYVIPKEEVIEVVSEEVSILKEKEVSISHEYIIGGVILLFLIISLICKGKG